MGHYEGEVIQLLSNLRATLLGKELVDGEGGGRESSVLPDSPHSLQSPATIKFVSKLAVLTEKERGEGEREKRKVTVLLVIRKIQTFRQQLELSLVIEIQYINNTKYS